MFSQFLQHVSGLKNFFLHNKLSAFSFFFFLHLTHFFISTEYWEKCMPAVEFLLKMVTDNEDITIGDHISEEQEQLEEKPYKVLFSL